MLAPRRAGGLAAAYAAALVYLSLLPFERVPLGLAEAWQRFQAIPFLALGVLDRADWIANLIAYIPLGFLLAAALGGRGRRAGAIVGATVLAAVLAVAIEFVQVFFSPRTASLNDLLAELIGAFVGVVAWPALAPRLDRWAHEVRAGGGRAARAFLWAYAAAYVLISLFPYDFVASAAELRAKLASGTYGLVFAPGQCGALAGCALKLAAEALAVAPLGWLLAAHRAPRRTGMGTGLAAGALLGIALELVQLLLASGRTQGMSVVTRSVGVALGVLAQRALPALGETGLVRLGRALTVVGIVPYVLLLAFAAGWFGATPMGLEAALARLPEFHYLPFYYHYFSTEARAVASALTYAVLYAPVGVAAWLWLRGRPAGAAIGALVAAALALAVEFSKAFLPGKHPDVTDALIAAASAWLAFKVLEVATTPERAGPAVISDTARIAPEGTPRPLWPLAVVALAIVAWSLIAFPAFRAPLALGLVAYAALLVRWPHAWLVVLPALLPVLDLAPWTGRLYWEEFDLLVLVTLAVRIVAGERTSTGAAAGQDPLPRLALGLLLVSLALSGARGLFPLQPIDFGTFGSYLGPYNALRMLKAAAWGFALVALLAREEAEGRGGIARLALGMALGTAAAAAIVAAERWTFPGLLDFGSDFRVAGLFSPMHVGGAYVEAYLVAGFPFVLHQALSSRRALLRGFWLAVAALAVYAVAVTYSRGGIAGLGIAALAMLLLWRPAQDPPRTTAPARLGRGAVAALLGAGIAALLAVPLLSGSYLGGRFATIGEDLAVRVAHWRRVLAIMDAGVATPVLGMGLGRFPVTYFWAGRPDAPPASLAFEKAPGDAGEVLRLGGGPGLFVDQRVALERGVTYTLALRVRSRPGEAPLTVALCEKSLIYSGACTGASVSAAPAWRTVSLPLRLEAPGAAGPSAARPAVLSLSNGRPGTVIEVDDVSLRDAAGRELLRNSAFAAAGDHWFVTSDDHLAWHAKSLPLHVYFEQGLLGLAAWTLLVVLGAGRLAARARSEPAAAAVLAALAGFVCVGLFDSLIDTPRFFVLFMLLVSVGLWRRRAPSPGRGDV